MRWPARLAWSVTAPVCVLVALAVTVSAARAQPADDQGTAAAAHRKAEHERIRHARAAITAKRQQDEAACYQRFSVEDCLRGVRAQVRDAEGRLRTHEIELNDAERKEKAAERLRSIEEKQKGASAPSTAPGAAVRSGPAAHSHATKAQRDQDAELRAQEQRNRLQAHDQEQSARNADTADRAAKARARQARLLQAAEERRARLEKSQADAAAAGRKPAAPLPTASSAK